MKKTPSLASFPFHTLLLSIYPILYLYSQNFVFIPIGQTLRSALLSAGVAGLMLAGFRFILKDWHKAGLLTSLLLVLFYSFGHVMNALEKSWSLWFESSPDASRLGWAWLLLSLFSSYLLLRARLPQELTRFVNLAALVLAIMPCATVIAPALSLTANSQRELAQLAQTRGEATAEATAFTPGKGAQPPDIYYIILDGYERADKLDELYHYDNSAFMDALRRRGFYVAEQSRSNYLNTTYSLNTSLNLVYFHDFPKNTFRKSRYNLLTNHVNEFLHKMGYRIVVYDSGTGDTNYQDYDIFVSPEANPGENQSFFNSFEMLLIRTTLGLEFFEHDTANNGYVQAVNKEMKLRRARITHALGHLTDYTTEDSPHFMFAHIYSPHIPFLYGPDRTELTYDPEINFYWYQPAPENYVQYYTYQIDYLNEMVLQTIDAILAASKRPTVIILQSDHGDDHYLNWNAIDAHGVDARSAILNAIYFSDGDYETLYPTMTPVNTFRVVLNHWFNTRYPLLPDKVYAHEHPLETRPNEIPEFTDGCTALGICLP